MSDPLIIDLDITTEKDEFSRKFEEFVKNLVPQEWSEEAEKAFELED